jgi:hypothetical protein
MKAIDFEATQEEEEAADLGNVGSWKKFGADQRRDIIVSSPERSRLPEEILKDKWSRSRNNGEDQSAMAE